VTEISPLTDARNQAGRVPQLITDYHAKYLAHELTKRCASDSMEKLASVLADAQVDLNPYQVDAALFAFRSPFSKGAILADEVGLGKTIEAGLLLSQTWAERKRRLLVILPANLRKQWSQDRPKHRGWSPLYLFRARADAGADPCHGREEARARCLPGRGLRRQRPAQGQRRTDLQDQGVTSFKTV
jgi:hypothetical protein